jgi:CRP/FNR family cyclic AMP-dependent transcriptional regulator
MTSEAMVKALQRMEFLQGLEPHQVEKLAAIAREVSFAADEVIFREGEVDNVVYLILEGQTAIDIYTSGRTWATILTVGPGQLLGWSSLFTQMRKTAKGRAVAPTRAIALNAPKLREVCEADHELGYIIGWRLAELIAGRLKATRLQLVDIFAPASQS